MHRGYAFVTYTQSGDASRAKEKLDGFLLGHKHMAVKWAHSISTVSYFKI